MTEIYMIQASTTAGDVAFTVYANTVEQMQQEVLDALYDGFIVSVAKLQKQENNDENN